MKNNIKTGILGLFALVMLAFTSCHKPDEDSPNKLIAGHWGCEQYVSHRTFDDGTDRWDTLQFEPVEGGEYELFLYENGKGLLKLNNSPALIKEFSCEYEYDTANQILNVKSSSWLYAIYGSLFLDENHAEFNVESLTDTTLVASWTNRVSEATPFFERFFIKRID